LNLAKGSQTIVNAKPLQLNWGQTDAKLERRSEKKLRQMGGDSDGGVQERHPPKLGQKKAKQEAEGDLAFRDLSGGNADQ
jgi:hypothetical protein